MMDHRIIRIAQVVIVALAFAGIGSLGIAAATFYAAAYAAMNVGIFSVITLLSGIQRRAPHHCCCLFIQ